MAELSLVNSNKKAQVDNEDYEWASKHTWRLNDDRHVVRDCTDGDGNPKIVYLCNEVMSRATGTPLERFRPPRPLKLPS
jgi:hypothetical protein